MTSLSRWEMLVRSNSACALVSRAKGRIVVARANVEGYGLVNGDDILGGR
jgi:ribosomal protein L15E